jgi:hypothetical protein
VAVSAQRSLLYCFQPDTCWIFTLYYTSRLRRHTCKSQFVLSRHIGRLHGWTGPHSVSTVFAA